MILYWIGLNYIHCTFATYLYYLCLTNEGRREAIMSSRSNNFNQLLIETFYRLHLLLEFNMFIYLIIIMLIMNFFK